MEHAPRLHNATSLFLHTVALSFALVLGFLFVPGAVHAASPTMTASTITADTDTDGTIDRITVFFSEAADLDDTGGAADGFTSITFNSGCTIVNGDYTGNGVTSKAFTVTGCTSQDTSITPLATYVAVANCATNFSICDDADANQMTNGARTAADGAGPVLISASPTNLQTGIRDSASITLTYSETVTTWGGSLSGSVPLTALINSAVVTLTHSARFLSGSNTLTISSAPDAAANAFAGAQAGDSTVASPLVFYVTSGEGDEESAAETTYSVNLLTPEEDDSFEAGSMTDITWESDGGSASYVNLYYSEDSGATWEAIVTNSLNDGEYSWTVPSLNSDDVMVKVVTTDLAEELATDTSAAFSVWYSSSDDAQDDDSENVTDDSTDDEDVPDEIDGIMAGDYIKLEGGSTIYYVDSSMMRRPFYDAQTYFTYEDDFDAVEEVSSETMGEFTIGAPMLPKAGVVLVKIQSVAKVYMVEEATDGSYELRWITSEDVAEEMFGSYWSSYVVDVDATLFTRYEEGDDVDSAEDVDTDMMKYREDLHE